VIDRLFPNDDRHKVNKNFLDGATEKATSIYNLLELCGISSFTLTSTELTKLFMNFHQQYGLRILYPKPKGSSPEETIRHMVSRVFEKICMKMNYSDAQILLVAEQHNCSSFVTWNVKHFNDRTHLTVKTPAEYEY
jgi:hypothetical protein